MKSQLTDQELVMQFINGSQPAIETLIHRHKTRVFTYISMYIRDTSLAEDIFQETFLKVINSLRSGKYRDNGKFLSWVMRIAHNLIIDHFRKEKQSNLLSNDDYETDLFNSKKLSDSNIEEELVRAQIEEDVRNLLDELPDDQREVVMLRHYAGLSFKEIADQTEVSINTALGRMRYALINMRKLMEKNNISLTVN
ncbi:MAG: sigma-70 family RNA polymerase sigma factor [Marinilabiliaceae bacterium]|nr:sigma-70 family RNA polymerase sigma factor [Marinilabiliaceae bacterium]